MRKSTILLTAVAATLATTGVFAYVLLSPQRNWDTVPTYTVDDRGLSTVTDGAGGLTATINAIKSNQAWNGAGKGTLIDAQAGSVASWQLGDGIPMLNFRDPEHACSGNCLAATFTGFYENRGDGTVRIFDADIVTNTRRIDWTSENEPDGCSGEYYIEGVMVHETGHGLGLGHTDVSGATMYPSVSSCNNGPASVAADDIAGIVALYPNGLGSSPPPEPPPVCDLGQRGDSCTSNAQCCSGKCRGPNGNQSCR